MNNFNSDENKPPRLNTKREVAVWYGDELKKRFGFTHMQQAEMIGLTYTKYLNMTKYEKTTFDPSILEKLKTIYLQKIREDMPPMMKTNEILKALNIEQQLKIIQLEKELKFLKGNK